MRRSTRQESGPALTLERIELIRRAIQSRDMSYADLGRVSGVAPRTIQSWLDEHSRERAQDGHPLRPRLLPHVLEALELKTALLRRPQYAPRGLDHFDVFLAGPMESIGDAYVPHRDDMLRIMGAMRDLYDVSVFYAGEVRPTKAEFEHEGWAVSDNLEILDSSRRFVAVYPGAAPPYSKPIASSLLIELGYAFARDTPILVFFRDTTDSLPFLLRMAPDVFEGCHLIRYTRLEDILEGVRRMDFFFQGI